ncbi:MAG: YkgJ family cysteine cluster protein [Desulforhopalus sp.]
MSLTSIIFSCTRCGYCCHGETTVSLDESDRDRMIKALAIDPDEVKESFWRVTGNIVQMKIEDGHCIFYNDGCKIHNGRPWRCAQWPLHPSILTDENNFHVIAESCPGIKQEVGYDKFCEILKKLMEESKVIC